MQLCDRLKFLLCMSDWHFVSWVLSCTSRLSFTDEIVKWCFNIHYATLTEKPSKCLRHWMQTGRMSGDLLFSTSNQRKSHNRIATFIVIVIVVIMSGETDVQWFMLERLASSARSSQSRMMYTREWWVSDCSILSWRVQGDHRPASKRRWMNQWTAVCIWTTDRGISIVEMLIILTERQR